MPSSLLMDWPEPVGEAKAIYRWGVTSDLKTALRRMATLYPVVKASAAGRQRIGQRGRTKTMTMTAEDYRRLARQQPLTPAGNAKAKDYYNLAIKEDPNYLPAYAELSYVFVREYQNAWGANRANSLAEAQRLADIAVVLGNDINSGWHNDFRGQWYRAIVSWNQDAFTQSFDEFAAARLLITDPARAVKDTANLDADMAEALIYYGEPNGAIALIQSAMARNPYFPYWYWWNLGRAYYMAKRFKEAIDAIGKITDPPNDVRLITAASEAQIGNTSSAQSIMAEFSKNDPDWSIVKSAAYYYRNDSDRQHWLDGLRKAGLKES
jgi:tetratricopeptide (TPR) repeat protein